MKKAYEVYLMRGAKMDVRTYIVISTSAETAISRAKREARKSSGVQSGWELTSITNVSRQVDGIIV